MTAPHFQVGDRVRAWGSTRHIRAGMVGTVHAVCLPTNQVYLIQFDDLPQLELAAERLLERVPEAPLAVP